MFLIPALGFAAPPHNQAGIQGLTCATASYTGAGTDTCTVILNVTVNNGSGSAVNLTSSNAAVQVPASVTVPYGANSTTFAASISAVSAAQMATLQAKGWKSSSSFNLQLNPAAPAAALSAISCSSGSLTGAASDACSVNLTAAAPSGGFAVALASNNTALTVPASLTIPAGAVSASFGATASAVSTTQTATVTASASGVTKATSIQLNAGTAGWSMGSASVAFGNVNLNTTSTQSVLIKSTGTAALTISSGSVAGTGFSISGLSFPTTLNPGQSATLNIGFDPTTTGTKTGTVTLVSNASSGGTATIALSGTGQSTAYAVDLTWGAPASSTDPVAGYNVYRSANGGGYQLLNASVNAPTSYSDSTVQSGTSYQYYVESVDAQGNQSTPSNTWSVTVP